MTTRPPPTSAEREGHGRAPRSGRGRASRGAVLAVEFKINFLSPAARDALIARDWVIRAGRDLATCVAEGFAFTSGQEKLVATMFSTIMTVIRPGLEG